MKKLMGLGMVASGILYGSGYKLPENSLNSMALSSAYIAHTMGADTAHFNPANMAFMDDKYYFEGALTLVRLPSQEYSLMSPLSGESKNENIIVPGMHFVSMASGDFRWGVSFDVPGGLSKRWDTPYQKIFAEEFTLKIMELNPSFSYKINDQFAVGGGISLIYSEGVVKSDAAVIGGSEVDMEGDTVAFGYNLAMTYKPTDDINMALTYRSKVDLGEKGNAKIAAGAITYYSGAASVSIPLPATLNIAVSKTWQDVFTLELNYERAFWSAYKALDFNYAVTLPTPLYMPYDEAKPKNWKDTDTFRIGATIKLNDKLTAMMGFALDESPVPLDTLGFELPDSDAKVFSMGFRYQQTENLSWGAAFLYDDKDLISVPTGVNSNPILFNGGSFNEGGAFLTTIGMSYEF